MSALVSLVAGKGPVMVRVRVSDYIAYEASGSSISVPGSKSGYGYQLEAALAERLRSGGTIVINREAAANFAEWCEDMAHAVGQGGNPAGARSLTNLATALRSVRDATNVPSTTTAPQGQKESSTMAAGTKGNTGRRVVARKGGTAAKATGSKATTAAKPKAAAKATGSTGRTGAVDKINKNVAKIAKALAGGATMKSQKAEYGISDDGPIRAALYRAGFDSKGAKHGETAGSIDPKTAAGKKKLVALRKNEGAAWFRLAFLSGLTEGEVKKVVEEAGGPTGRVYIKTEKEAAASGR